MKKLYILFMLMLLVHGASYLPFPEEILRHLHFATMLLSTMVVGGGIIMSLVPTPDLLKEEVEEMLNDIDKKGR